METKAGCFRAIEPYTIGNKGSWGAMRETPGCSSARCSGTAHGGAMAGFARRNTASGRMHRRFCRWRDKRIWERILEALIDEPDFEWLISMPATSMFIPMRLGLSVATKI